MKDLFRNLHRRFTAGVARVHWVWPVSIVIVGICIAIPLLSAFATTKTTFVIVAETEHVHGAIAADSELAWNLHNASICSGVATTITETNAFCSGTVYREGFIGHLEILSAVRFTVERLADGPLEAAIEPDGQETFRVRLIQDLPKVHTEWLDPPVFLHIEPPDPAAGQVTAFPIVAPTLLVGREPALKGVGPHPMLRSGTLTAFAQTIVGNRSYDARELILRTGDEVSVAKPTDLHNGIIRMDERPALQTVFRVQAESALVRGFLTAPQTASVTFLDRLLNDATVTIIFSGMALFISIAASLASIFIKGAET